MLAVLAIAVACVFAPQGWPIALTAAAEESGENEAAVRRQLADLEGDLAAARLERLRLESESSDLRDELADIERRLTATATSVREHEQRVTAMQADLATLAVGRQEAEARLDVRRDGRAAMLMALERIARLPPQAYLLTRGAPADLFRSAAALKGAVAALDRRASSLRQDIVSADEATAAVDAHREALVAAREELSVERTRLARLRDQREELQQRIAAHHSDSATREAWLTAKIAELRERAGRLAEAERAERALMTAMVTQKPPPPGADASLGGGAADVAGDGAGDVTGEKAVAAVEPAAPPVEAKTVTPAPASVPPAPKPAPMKEPRQAAAAVAGPVFPTDGRILTRFGAEGVDRKVQKGMTFAAAPGAEVVAPASGRVAFAGPFRGYGLLLIVEHANGYHTLLAGLDRIETETGRHVASGEAVGAMGRPQNGTPNLYLELRKNGQPVNPLPWLTAGKRKVSG